MSRLTKPGLSHPPSIGGTGICIDQIDEGAILIGNGVDFDLATLTAGAGLSIINSPGGITISAAGTYVLPIASASVLGGIKVGSNLTIDGSGVLSGSAPYVLPIASGSVLGGIKVGANLSIDGGGVLSGAAPYTLPIASGSVLGGIKVGNGMITATDGTMRIIDINAYQISSVDGSVVTGPINPTVNMYNVSHYL